MIDLTRQSLPHGLLVGDDVYELDTSFRTWIKFERLLTQEGMAWPGIFACEPPQGPEWVSAAVEFLQSKNECPHGEPRRGARALDLVADGDYITAAFQQAYGIDLTTGDMHWHRFKALLNGLPDGTVLSKIIGYRTYETPPKNADRDAEMRRLRSDWSLPDPLADARAAALNAWFDDLAGRP